MDEKSERTTKMDSAAWGVASFEHSGLRGVDSAVELDIRRRALQILPITAKLLISATTTLVNNIAIFATPALVCCCPHDL